MPKQTNIEKQIPDLYKSSALNLLLFSYVRGVRAALHTVAVADAIDMFMDEFGLTDDDLNRSTALTTYNRMQKKLINLIKT